ncbi:asparaginase [Candidatus Woesearchaeota archaeon]|nr:asparaginase [Candidatus Woesearchaeota archaeon]
MAQEDTIPFNAKPVSAPFVKSLDSSVESNEVYRKFIDEQIPEPTIVVDWMGKEKKPRILVLYTGGTLGMKYVVNPDTGEKELVPQLTLEELLIKCDYICNIKERYNILGYKVSHIDSTEINIKVWQNLAHLVNKHYEEFDGVVVAHGTDTMEYSAAAMAFAIRNPYIPIIFTGAQIILERDGTDVITNLTGALALAKSRLAEVAVLFNGEIYKGTRVNKKHDSWLDGFNSPIYGLIGHLGAHGVELDPRAVLRGTYTPNDLVYNPEFATSVLEIVLAPGLSPKVVEAAITESECKALVIRSYGPGNLPRWYYPLIEQKSKEGFPIFISSQCAGSGISLGGSEYAGGKGAIRAGAVPIGDMSPAATTVKLMNIMARTNKLADIQREMIGNVYASEITRWK